MLAASRARRCCHQRCSACSTVSRTCVPGAGVCYVCVPHGRARARRSAVSPGLWGTVSSVPAPLGSVKGRGGKRGGAGGGRRSRMVKKRSTRTLSGAVWTEVQVVQPRGGTPKGGEGAGAGAGAGMGGGDAGGGVGVGGGGGASRTEHMEGLMAQQDTAKKNLKKKLWKRMKGAVKRH